MSTELFQDAHKEAAEIERLRAMTLSRFRLDSTWVKVESSLLPSFIYGEIFIASDERQAELVRAENPRAVVYGPGEITRLIELNPGPETMVKIHEAKAVLGGRVVEVKESENHVESDSK